jgi:hypothetical protein
MSCSAPSGPRTSSLDRRRCAVAPSPGGVAARRAERPTRVIGTTRPDRGQAGAPAGRPASLGPSQLAGEGRPRTNELDAGRSRAGWYSRRVRASAERGRVQGPGRAEADLGPRTITVVAIPCAILRAPPDCSRAILRCRVPPRMGPQTTPLIPPLMGPPTPPLMGPPGGGGPVGAGLGAFALVRTLAGRGHAQKPRGPPPRFAT